ncbi:MAG: Na+ dependent nucleoside transporter N-terminal domain-containing protein, partial [Cetobacterium somerae]
MSILRSIFGIFVILFLGYLLSYDRKNIKWRTVVSGFALQFVFAFIVMKTTGGAYVLESVSNGF